MRTIIKNLTKLAIIAVLAFAGTAFANASFVQDPANKGTGFTSIAQSFSDANKYNSISAGIPNPQDSKDFYVFMNYQYAATSSNDPDLTNVRAYLDYSATSGRGGTTSVTFSGDLTSNSGSASDPARLTGLPSSWNIQLLSADKINDHHLDAACGSSYGYDIPINGLMSSSGAYIGTLDAYLQSSTNPYYGGCSQGHVVAKFRITNTEPIVVDTYSWQTGPWGACINNIQERTVQCINDRTQQVVSDRNCRTLKPATTRVCSGGGSGLNVDTLSAVNITETSAELRGDLISGGPADQYWFALSSSTKNPGCNSFSGVQLLYPNAANGEIGGGSDPSFKDMATGLVDNTDYYFRACARKGSDTDEGQVLSFRTDDNGNGGGSEPEADTQSEDDVDGDSAELNGRIEMNGFQNGEVFFVYGQDEDRIRDTEYDYDSYSDARSDEDRDEFEVVLVEGDNDTSSWRNFRETVNSLDEDERYYYQICVGYYDNGDQLVCGGTEDFRTDDDSDGDVEIETTSVQDYGPTFAIMCGDLEDDGGDSSLRTRIEFRETNGGSSWSGSNYIQRGEGPFCVQVNNLRIDTRYQYRACTDEGDCGDIRSFTTNAFGGPQVPVVNVNTLSPSNIGASSAILNAAFQGTPVEPTQVWFEWGSTPALGTQKQVFTKVASAGTFSDSFTGLRSCRDYYYRAVARNSAGVKYGNIISFRTSCVINAGGGTVVQRPTVTVVEEVEESTIDLDSLGLGLSLIRLDIDNNQDALFRDQVVQYEITWENISTIDLDDIDLKITMPEEIAVTSVSRGRFDADENIVFYNIEDLDEGEFGSMTVSGIVTRGSLGDVVTAEATAAYNNPVNDAQENATDYDIDEFVLNTNFGTASVFGLSNITFLGWLTILLGLLIIFLIARWLYLEREELRAQAYANGYRPQLYGDPRYDYQRGPANLGAPQNMNGYEGGNAAPVDNYQPYRPNRGQ